VPFNIAIAMMFAVAVDKPALVPTKLPFPTRDPDNEPTPGVVPDIDPAGNLAVRFSSKDI
jgi:hypothetical protein